jgi:hypothetical protein
MKFVYDDGGRAAAGFKGKTGDCVTRAIAIATGQPYREVYDALWSGLRGYADSHKDRTARRIKSGKGRRGSTPRKGVSPKIFKPYLLALGWNWTPTMQIGSGCRVHLREDELPPGHLIVSVSKHLVAVVDGVIHDTHDCSRGGTRCVYGYFQAPQGSGRSDSMHDEFVRATLWLAVEQEVKRQLAKLEAQGLIYRTDPGDPDAPIYFTHRWEEAP